VNTAFSENTIAADHAISIFKKAAERREGVFWPCPFVSFLIREKKKEYFFIYTCYRVLKIIHDPKPRGSYFACFAPSQNVSRNSVGDIANNLSLKP
jgi:hypothetical protein